MEPFAVAGLRIGVACAGIKYPDRRDLVVIEAAAGSQAAAVFTQNAFCAAPVQVARAHLAATARPAVARLSPDTAASVGASETLTVSTDHGSITLPLELTDMPTGVVWLPLNSPGSTVHATLGVAPGAVVSISGAAT